MVELCMSLVASWLWALSEPLREDEFEAIAKVCDSSGMSRDAVADMERFGSSADKELEKNEEGAAMPRVTFACDAEPNLSKALCE